jgi:hypothetical protein
MNIPSVRSLSHASQAVMFMHGWYLANVPWVISVMSILVRHSWDTSIKTRMLLSCSGELPQNSPRDLSRLGATHGDSPMLASCVKGMYH